MYSIIYLSTGIICCNAVDIHVTFSGHAVVIPYVVIAVVVIPPVCILPVDVASKFDALFAVKMDVTLLVLVGNVLMIICFKISPGQITYKYYIHACKYIIQIL